MESIVRKVNARHVYALLAGCHALLLIGYLPFAKQPASLVTVSVVLVSVALIYDNVIVALGHRIVSNNKLFMALSRPRFIMHLAFTPLLGAAALAGSKYEKFAWPLAGSLIVLGFVLDKSRKREMFIVEYWKSVRYSERPPVPPLPAILTTFAVILGGVLRDRLPITFGGCAMLCLATLPPSIHGPLPSQAGEVMIMYGIWNSLL